MGTRELQRIVDGCGQKLINSGLNPEHTRRKLVNRIKGYKGGRTGAERKGGNKKRRANESWN